MGAIHFFSLNTKCQTRIYLFVSLFIQKIRYRVLVSYILELGVCLIILDVFLKLSLAFRNTGAALDRCCTKIVAQQNNVMKHSFSAPVVKSKKALHVNLLKTELHHKYSSKHLIISSEQRY